MYVALYARVSTTRQAEKDLSIPDQLNQMRQWCKANGHLVVQEYIEERWLRLIEGVLDFV